MVHLSTQEDRSIVRKTFTQAGLGYLLTSSDNQAACGSPTVLRLSSLHLKVRPAHCVLVHLSEGLLLEFPGFTPVLS